MNKFLFTNTQTYNLFYESDKKSRDEHWRSNTTLRTQIKYPEHWYVLLLCCVSRLFDYSLKQKMKAQSFIIVFHLWWQWFVSCHCFCILCYNDNVLYGDSWVHQVLTLENIFQRKSIVFYMVCESYKDTRWCFSSDFTYCAYWSSTTSQYVYYFSMSPYSKKTGIVLDITDRSNAVHEPNIFGSIHNCHRP